MFVPVFSGTVGSMYIFPSGWKEGDNFLQGKYILHTNGEIVISKAENDMTVYRYEFVDETHFVFYYPYGLLNPHNEDEIMYQAELVKDE